MSSFTEKQVNEMKGVGASFVRDWLRDGNDPNEFDGQSEASDLAQGFGCGEGLGSASHDVLAEYVYEGMLEVMKESTRL